MSWDGFISYDGVLYGLPSQPAMAGALVLVREHKRELRIFHQGELVVTLQKRPRSQEIVLHPEQFEQVWPSDNTDALDRLLIQEGFSYANSSRVLMGWVTDCPNFLTRRTVPLSYRFHVAMFGSLGIGGDISRWTSQELEEARGFIARYKQVRSTIQNGLLYRLCSLRKGRVAAAQYVARDDSEVVVCAWGHSQQFGETQLSLALYSLKADAHYVDTISGATYSGAYLTYHGLPVNLVGDFDSYMIHLVDVTFAS